MTKINISGQNKDLIDLTGRLYGKADPDQLKPAILFLNGWSPANIAWTPMDIQAAVYSAKLNTINLRLAFRGMGSKGNIQELTRADFLQDALNAFDTLAGLPGVDRNRISVVGESFGAYMACVLSTQRAVKSLALRVPSDFPDEGFDTVPQVKFALQFSREWKLQAHHFTESRALLGLHEFQGKVLLVAAEKDGIVPFQTTQNYLNAVSEPDRVDYTLMASAGHALINPFQAIKFFEFQKEWLERNI